MPGKPLLVVENTAARRKTHTQVALTDKRLFQSEASHAAVSRPETAFAYLVPLLGKELNSTEFRRYIEAFRQQLVRWVVSDPARQCVGGQVDERKTAYDLEEILAMILRNAKLMVDRMASESVSECVVAVAPYLDYFQRLALNDALKLAGLKPLAYINENLAASVRYTIDGALDDLPGNPNKSVVMYINMGAASFKVSIVTHSKGVDPETKKPADKVEIVGEAWDTTLGGRQFDYELAEVMADKFNALPARKGKPDVRTNAKAMRRLLDKAEDVKEKLSASKVFKVYLDSLLDYVSLNVRAMCQSRRLT